MKKRFYPLLALLALAFALLIPKAAYASPAPMPTVFDLTALAALPDGYVGEGFFIHGDSGAGGNIIMIATPDAILLAGDSGGRPVVVTHAKDITLSPGTKITSEVNYPALVLYEDAIIRGQGEDIVIESKLSMSGLEAFGNVTIDGSIGSISATGATGGTGIYAVNDIIISGTVLAISGNTGIRSAAGNIIISGDVGNITGTDRNGILANQSVTIEGRTGNISGIASAIEAYLGNVTILGSTGAISGITIFDLGPPAHGIWANNGNITIGGEVESISATINGILAMNVTIGGTIGNISGGGNGIWALAGGGVVNFCEAWSVSGTESSGITGRNITISGTTGAISGGERGIVTSGGAASIITFSGNGPVGQITGGAGSDQTGGIVTAGSLIIKDNLMIYASSAVLSDLSSFDIFSPLIAAPGSRGILFEDDKATVYGNVTLSENLIIAEGYTLNIPGTSVLNIPNGVTLYNGGTVRNHGVIESWTNGFRGSGSLIGGAVRYRSNVANIIVTQEVSKKPEPPTPAKSLYTVNANFLNERSGPGTHFPLVGRLARGTVVEIIEFSPDGEWVLAHTGTWLAVMYLNHLSGPVRPLETEVSLGQVTAYAVNISPASRLFVRNAPGMNGRVVGTLRAGDIVRVTGISNGWAAINYTSSIPTAYVSAAYLWEIEEIAARRPQ
ncbi:MAG: SH3 domain-containing protein [Lachnospiraceae bacterium]|nr:SH3 domain-containing protein [Lachnospiraceae bacterium]